MSGTRAPAEAPDKQTVEQPLSIREQIQAQQAALEARQTPRSYWSTVGYHLRHDRLTLIAIGLLALLALLSFTSPLITEHILHTDPNRIELLKT